MNKNEAKAFQLLLTDPPVVYVKKKQQIPNIDYVLAEPPCFSCIESMAPSCDVKGCPKLTTWLCGDEL